MKKQITGTAYPTKGPQKTFNDVQELMNDLRLWADETFGHDRRAVSALHHLKDEADEAIREIEDGDPYKAIVELADCFLLVLDAAGKHGVEFELLYEVSVSKLAISKGRKWGPPDENGVCHHILD